MDKSLEMAKDPSLLQYDLSLVPWGGTALPVRPQGAIDGIAYVFLPLPCQTGLPVHINGFFEVSENRRDIWYGTDMSGAGKVRSGM